MTHVQMTETCWCWFEGWTCFGGLGSGFVSLVSGNDLDGQ